MMRRMKYLASFLFVGLFACFTGCAVTEGSLEDVGGQLQQGLEGRGRIVPDNPTSDSFGPVYN